MIKARSTFWLTLILFLGIAISVILMMYSGNNHHKKYKTSIQMDSFMNNVSYHEYDENGAIKSILSAQHVEHFKDENELFSKPHLIIYSTDGSSWQVQAQKGVSKNKNAQVDLFGDVTLYHAADKDSPETLVSTSTATYYPKTNTMETKSPVVIKRPDAIIRGVGAVADLKKQIMTILSHARADYVLNAK